MSTYQRQNGGCTVVSKSLLSAVVVTVVSSVNSLPAAPAKAAVTLLDSGNGERGAVRTTIFASRPKVEAQKGKQGSGFDRPGADSALGGATAAKAKGSGDGFATSNASATASGTASSVSDVTFVINGGDDVETSGAGAPDYVMSGAPGFAPGSSDSQFGISVVGLANLSTWAMVAAGLAGLGLAGRRSARRRPTISL